MTKESAKESIEKLVSRFREHREQYHASDYNEQKVRQDFINPFFKALGWDVDNERGDSEPYCLYFKVSRVQLENFDFRSRMIWVACTLEFSMNHLLVFNPPHTTPAR